MWWSFGSGLLTDWCLCVCTLWQCFDYSDCDSAADSCTFAYCNALTGFGDRGVSAAGSKNAAIPRCEWISPDEHEFARFDGFGLVLAFDQDSPITRMLPGSTPCELRLMLHDAKLGIDGIHDVIIENLSASPTWRSSHISPADITALRRRWPKTVFSTLSRRAPDVERLRRDAPKRADRAFRHSGLGFCGVCDTRVYTALDAQMIAFHLELAQLWCCPVE